MGGWKEVDWIKIPDTELAMIQKGTGSWALLRNPSQKPAAFEDFLKLREKIDELGCDVAKLP